MCLVGACTIPEDKVLVRLRERERKKKGMRVRKRYEIEEMMWPTGRGGRVF